MTFSDVFDIVKVIVLDWRLIVAFVIVILYLNFIFYVSKYRKKKAFKPSRVVKQKAPTPAPATPSETEQGSEANSEPSAGGDDFV